MISIIVNVFNMQREAVRTLYTLSASYQSGINSDDYEVIVIENGSSKKLGAELVKSFGNNFRYINIATEDAHPSPVNAINFAVSKSLGSAVGIILDGARMVTPGLIRTAKDALHLSANTIVGTIAWHLGPSHQSISVHQGYSQISEDALLHEINWRADGYRLFEHAAWAFSNSTGHFGPIAESCATFMSRKFYDDIGGYDPLFKLPGGGYATLDFFKRCCEVPDINLVMLAGEGSFHQFHGGVTTGFDASEYGQLAAQEYQEIRGIPYAPPNIRAVFYGMIKQSVYPWLARSIEANSTN
jgi:glycosyltransferase involved in cell wall biosynthesis